MLMLATSRNKMKLFSWEKPCEVTTHMATANDTAKGKTPVSQLLAKQPRVKHNHQATMRPRTDKRCRRPLASPQQTQGLGTECQSNVNIAVNKPKHVVKCFIHVGTRSER